MVLCSGVGRPCCRDVFPDVLHQGPAKRLKDIVDIAKIYFVMCLQSAFCLFQDHGFGSD